MRIEWKRLGMIGFLGAATVWADSAGVRPRPNLGQYPASMHVPKATVAVAVLSPDEVRHTFAANLSKGYVVLEVAVYPDRDNSVRISPEDFMLQLAGQGDVIRPAEPAVIASAIQDKRTSSPGGSRRSTIDVVPTASVGRVSEVYTDPTTGQRRTNSGWVTSTGVEVYGPVGAPAGVAGPSTSSPDRDTIEAELLDKSLPEGTIGQPTAGYLFFPAPKASKRNRGYELEYLGQSSELKLAVPPPTSH